MYSIRCESVNLARAPAYLEQYRLARRRKTKKRAPKKYQHPVPKRAEILRFLENKGRPMSEEEILDQVGSRDPGRRQQVSEKLQKMVRAGQLLVNRRGQFCLVERLDLLTGSVRGHRDGFGFVLRDDGGDDIYLSAREMQALFDGDRVTIRVVGADRRGRPEGSVVDILERGVTEIAGKFIRERGVGLVIPDNPRFSHRILIAKGEAGGARPGQIVVARILDYPSFSEQATGKIIRVVGEASDRGIATDIAIHAHGIPNEWSRAVQSQAKQFGEQVESAAKRDRVDLRDVNLVTIDGADARDFDDAVFAEPSGNGFRLLVAIADVGHYVEQDSAIDKEAVRRGTSVYFPDRVVPMLPEILSNGLCSLNPGVDRLCMVCDMRIGPDGKVTSSKFYEGVMRSKARLTYSEVHAFLAGQDPKAVPKEVADDIRHLASVYRLFARNRRRRGAVELDIPQTRIEVGRDGSVVGIQAVARNDAHRLIEECMIAANVQAAKFLRRNRVRTLYRVHARPDPQKFDDLRLFLVSLGLKVPHPDHVRPRDFARIAEQVADRSDAAAIYMAMLRSMAHAEYTPENIGHFGLALDAYAHFTSPIRRYPDLMVHRAIRHLVRGGKPGAFPWSAKRVEQLGILCSAHERRAEDATREVEAWLKCQYMEGRVGQEFPGVITGVTNFGAFVQISELQVDGLLHVTSLGSDYFRFEAHEQALVGDRSGRRFGLGDAVTVIVARVDLESRRIDFHLAEDRGGSTRPTRR